MSVYSLIILISICFMVLKRNETSITNKNRHSFMFLFFIAVIYVGIRYRIGTDSFAYAYLYENVVPITKLNAKILSSYRLEPLWYIYLSILKAFCSDFIIVQITSAILLNAAYFKFIRYHSNHPFTAVSAYLLIDYLLINCEFMRQALAIAIFYLFVFDKLEKNQLAKYYVLSIICCFFHTTMIVVLLFPIANKINISLKYIVAIVIISAFVFSRYNIFGIISSLFPNSSVWALKNEAYSNMGITINFNYIIQKLYVAFFAMVAFLKVESSKLKSYLSLYMIIIVLSFSHDIFSRILYIMSPMYMVAIADMAHHFEKRIKSQSAALIVCVALAFVPNYFYYNHTYQSSSIKVYSKFFPYSSYLNKFQDKDREALGQAEQFYQNMFE